MKNISIETIFTIILLLVFCVYIVFNVGGCAGRIGKSLVPLRYEYKWFGTIGHYRDDNTGTCYRSLKGKDATPMWLTQEKCE